jgi:hypothetical protein
VRRVANEPSLRVDVQDEQGGPLLRGHFDLLSSAQPVPDTRHKVR